MELLTSSTAAMLAELMGATDRGENIVVTLWHPHWAYGAFPVRDLEDPKQAMGDNETLHTFSRIGFEDDYPEVAEWIRNFEMSSDIFAELESLLFFEHEGEDPLPIIKDWSKDNQEYIDSLTQ